MAVSTLKSLIRFRFHILAFNHHSVVFYPDVNERVAC